MRVWNLLVIIVTCLGEDLPSLSAQNGLSGRPRQRNSLMQPSDRAGGSAACKDICMSPGCVTACEYELILGLARSLR